MVPRACDLAIGWTLFSGRSRRTFQTGFELDAGTWARGRGWALWNALILLAGLSETTAPDFRDPAAVLTAVLADD